MKTLYSNQFSKFDTKSGGSMTNTPRKDAEIALGEFRLAKIPVGTTRAEMDNDEKGDKKHRQKHIARIQRSKTAEKKDKIIEIEPSSSKKGRPRWSSKKPTPPQGATTPTKAPNTPKRQKGQRREKSGGKEKEPAKPPTLVSSTVPKEPPKTTGPSKPAPPNRKAGLAMPSFIKDFIYKVNEQ